MSFEKSVFINCPFDNTYNLMLYSMIFTIVSMGYSPRLSLESSDASVIRLDKILDIIKQSKISIHDLSKIKPNKKDEFSRLNMPFELGIDFGCKKYALEDDNLSNKKFLIIGSKPYEYMKAISDISGIDIEYHDDKEEYMIKAIRHWFVKNEKLEGIASPNEIWMKFMDFNAEFVLYTREKGYTPANMYEMPINEQINLMKKFLWENPYNN